MVATFTAFTVTSPGTFNSTPGRVTGKVFTTGGSRASRGSKCAAWPGVEILSGIVELRVLNSTAPGTFALVCLVPECFRSEEA